MPLLRGDALLLLLGPPYLSLPHPQLQVRADPEIRMRVYLGGPRSLGRGWEELGSPDGSHGSLAFILLISSDRAKDTSHCFSH